MNRVISLADRELVCRDCAEDQKDHRQGEESCKQSSAVLMGQYGVPLLINDRIDVHLAIGMAPTLQST
jgi:thiamine monophosphate synthase